MNLKEIAEDVIIELVEEPGQIFIINNVQTEQKRKSVLVKCRHCNSVITKFNVSPDTTMESVVNWFKSQAADLEKQQKYCSNCGTKLSYNVAAPMDFIEENGVYVYKNSTSEAAK